jgi:hypothetical protein
MAPEQAARLEQKVEDLAAQLARAQGILEAAVEALTTKRAVEPRLVRAKTLSERFDGLSLDYIYKHAADLGGVYLGEKRNRSDKTRMLFDPEIAEAHLRSRAVKPPRARRRAQPGGRRPRVRTDSADAGFKPLIPLPSR